MINTLPDGEHGDDIVEQIQEDGLQRHHGGAEASENSMVARDKVAAAVIPIQAAYLLRQGLH